MPSAISRLRHIKYKLHYIILLELRLHCCVYTWFNLCPCQCGFRSFGAHACRGPSFHFGLPTTFPKGGGKVHPLLTLTYSKGKRRTDIRPMQVKSNEPDIHELDFTVLAAAATAQEGAHIQEAILQPLWHKAYSGSLARTY